MSVRISRRPTLKPRTDLYVYILGGREFQTNDPENAKNILYRSMRVRDKTVVFLLISSRRSVKKVAYILRRSTHMHFKHKHSCVVHKLFLQWKNANLSKVLPSLTGSDQVI